MGYESKVDWAYDTYYLLNSEGEKKWSEGWVSKSTFEKNAFLTNESLIFVPLYDKE